MCGEACDLWQPVHAQELLLALRASTDPTPHPRDRIQRMEEAIGASAALLLTGDTGPAPARRGCRRLGADARARGAAALDWLLSLELAS